MTRITNADQVLLLLRNQLERAGRSRRTTRKDLASPRQRTALQRVRDIATNTQISENDLRHALVAGILIDEFGAEFAGDARFQEVVANVVRIMSDSPQSLRLLNGVLGELAKR